MNDVRFEYAQIFPPIGVARVGNSSDEFFIGPEAPGIVPNNGASYKDAAGRVKRQAARFRIYAYGPDGAVEELTADHPAVEQITWTVTLANRKAEWWRFEGSRRVADLVTGSELFRGATRRRNSNVTGEARKGLVIGPSSGSINGRAARGSAIEGTFAVPGAEPKTVYLGELRTDPAGRLLVLGGRGESASVLDDNPTSHYANNDGWHDDTADGPVTATVTLKGGSELRVRQQAWIVVAPPHYSPHTENVVPLYDVMLEAAMAHDLPWPERELGRRPRVDDPITFNGDIYPVLARMSRYQWLSQRAHRGHSAGRPGDFLTSETVAVLADPEKAKEPASLHGRVFGRIRRPYRRAPFVPLQNDGVLVEPNSQIARDQASLAFMPPLAGDEGDVELSDVYPPVSKTGAFIIEKWLTVTELQYRKLASWHDGNFTAGEALPVRPFDEIPVAEQPLALTRAALEASQGGAFYPGIEMTSIVRFKELYNEAFRVSEKLSAGDLSKWMALPWQADFYECRGHWWPSVRPDDVVPVGEYEEILDEFGGEAENKRLASLLVVRKPWTRGLGVSLPARPGVPPPRRVVVDLPADEDTPAALRRWTVEDRETLEDYRRRCHASLSRFPPVFERFLPEAMAGELGQVYRARLEDFLARTLGEYPSLPEPPDDLDAYREIVLAGVAEHLAGATRLEEFPEPAEGEALATYADRLAVAATSKRAWQGLFDLEWRRRVVNRGKADLIVNWSRLGFVVPRTANGETVYVEADRGRFDLLPARESFNHLMNLEHRPEFLPTARELAEEFIAQAATIERDMIRVTPFYEEYAFFSYHPVTFQARLEKIYEKQRVEGELYNPATGVGEPLFRTPAQVVERIRQLAPFNQLDGGWLERAVRGGPIDDIRSFLFEIWSDEIGNGDPAQNHANVYTDLMHSAGIYLPPLSSLAYAHHPTLWNGSFSGPAYHAAISQFPETFFPELLGMTLYLEWEAVFLPAMVKLYEYHGYNSLFYRLHVAIDNPVNGHGARARDAVMRYLDNVSSQSGPEEMQEHWRRIWNGYIAFKFIGDSEWQYRFANPPTLTDRMLEMLEQKRHYAQRNHGVLRFGANSLNDLFDEPDQLMEVLANSDLIVRGDASRSPIFDLMSTTGPMLKVFTEPEKRLWAEWINSLPRDPVGAALDPGAAMRVLLGQLAARGVGVPQHGSHRLRGTVLEPATGRMVDVSQPVNWWFQVNQPEQFMRALADPANGWIVPGRVDQSRFVSDFLGGSGAMSRFLSRTVPELGDRPARTIITDWIAAGCPQPRADVTAARRATAKAAGAEHRFVATATRRTHDSSQYVHEVTQRTLQSETMSREQRLGMIRRHYGPGGGAAH